MLAGTVKIFFIAYRKLFDVVSNYYARSILLNSFVDSYKNPLVTVLFHFFLFTSFRTVLSVVDSSCSCSYH